MSEVADTLGNDSRLLLLRSILDGEQSVESLSRITGISVASTSQHLQVLKKANMVVSRREGRNILYRLQSGPLRELLDALERFVVFHAAQSGPDTDQSGAAAVITSGQLKKKLKAKAVTLIDVRSRGEYRKSHIAGAIGIPLDELTKDLGKLPRNGELVVYCRGPNCILSVKAVALLRAHGFAVSRLVSGFSRWHGDRVWS
ncbi:MAG: metalloregulator ArsR/SmtB family transcription factor [Spirochaetales bacterium]|nr:metalloregulator ArsR/SmtB family transcription factor [Leptospiraceae bacterium]MCP5481314.1 metalloregulator ArsR/SmtB family transcription factor [Spirochaetales bacterium]MCP5485750.1 metalloregulator ArsR/SmtB family transcription factor [Spirochaetales bacterium]